jgi:hypothetical protein
LEKAGWLTNFLKISLKPTVLWHYLQMTKSHLKWKEKSLQGNCTGKIIPRLLGDGWSDLLHDVAEASQKGCVLIILDEISWMASKDPTFLGKIKIAWDNYFKKNAQLVLILSDSNSSWIEKNILSSTGYVARILLRLILKELSLPEWNRFWKKGGATISAYKKFKILSVEALFNEPNRHRIE